MGSGSGSSGSNMSFGQGNAQQQAQFGQNVWGPQGNALGQYYNTLSGQAQNAGNSIAGQQQGVQSGINNATNLEWGVGKTICKVARMAIWDYRINLISH